MLAIGLFQFGAVWAFVSNQPAFPAPPANTDSFRVDFVL